MTSKKVLVLVSENLVSEKKGSVSVSENLVSEKSLGFGIRKFGLGKEVSVLVSEKNGFRFRRIWSRKKKSRFWFRKIWSRKKVSVSENLVMEKKYRFRRIWSRKKSISFGFGKSGLGIGFGQNFGIVRKLSRLSRNFPDRPENIQHIQKLSRLSGNFPDHPENIQPTRKLSRLSGNFLYHPENIQPIRKLSKGSGNFPVQFQGLRAKTFRTRKNFPDGNATLPPRFLRLCPPYGQPDRKKIAFFNDFFND